MAVVAYGMSMLGWLVPNTELDLPFLTFADKSLTVFMVGVILFVVLDLLMDFVYSVFILVTLGIGCLTLPVWIVLSGSLVLWLTTLSGAWIITTPGPLFFIAAGFTLSLMGNIAAGLTSSEKKSSK